MCHTLAMGEGSVKEVRPGVWRVRIDAGVDPLTGKRIQVSKVVHGGIRAAQSELRKLAGASSEGKARRSTASVETFLRQWIEWKAPSLSPRTVQLYERLLETVVIPKLGGMRLADLKARELDRLYRELEQRGTSVYVLRQVHVVIRSALSTAVKWGVVEVNVAKLASQPTVPHKDVSAPSPGEVARIVARGIERFGSPMGAFFALAAVTGARRGELLGLRIGDVDLGTRIMTIQRSVIHTKKTGLVVKSTKTDRSRRVSLDEVAVAVLVSQIGEVKAVESAGFHLVDDPYLFPGDPSGGAPWHPDWPTHAFRNTCDDLGMKWHFHQLRHFTATQLIAAGLDVRTVSGRLGHADPSVTLRVYSHVVEAKDREAAAIMGGLLAPSKAIGGPEPKKVLSKRRVAKDQGN